VTPPPCVQHIRLFFKIAYCMSILVADPGFDFGWGVNFVNGGGCLGVFGGESLKVLTLEV